MYTHWKHSNFITASIMEIISEAHVFAEKSGLGSEMLENLIDLNWGGILAATSSRITSGAYIPPIGE
jgi:3-hydroxyisobutyrate dehydrogenase-like beta-hydroxyacid dehydrogenase